MWNDVAYEPGELKAIACKVAVQIGESIMKSAEEPSKIKLTANRSTIDADGMELSYITFESLDKNGNNCRLADHVIDLEVKEAAIIAGVGNGDPQSNSSFQSNQVKLLYGKPMLILQSSAAKGSIMVSASAKGLAGATTTIITE
jgi:beta-galactosidase